MVIIKSGEDEEYNEDVDFALFSLTLCWQYLVSSLLLVLSVVAFIILVVLALWFFTP